MPTLAEWREKRFMTVLQLSRYSSVNRNTIYAIESGRTTSPHRETVRLLCDALRTEPHEVDEFHFIVQPRSRPGRAELPPAYELPPHRESEIPEAIKSIGAWIYEFGYTQVQLTQMTGLSHMTIQRAIDRSARPSQKTIRLLCDALDLTPNHVIEFVFSLRFHPYGPVAGRMSGGRYILFVDFLRRIHLEHLYQIVRLTPGDINLVIERTGTPVDARGYIFADAIRPFFPKIEVIQSETISEVKARQREENKRARETFTPDLTELLQRAKPFDTSRYEDGA